MNIILDGFNHYGASVAGRAAMLAGAYAQVDGNAHPSTVRPRTDAMSLDSGGNTVGNPFWRRVIPSSRTKLFMGMAHYLSNLPANSQRYAFAQFRTNANASIVSFGLSSTGQVQIRTGGLTGAVLAESDPAFLAGNFTHVECMAFVNGIASSAECRINGVTVVSINDIDLGSTPISQFCAGPISVNSHDITNFYHADLRVGDDLGGVNDDFMGDRRVYTLMPNADGPVSEFVPNSGVTRYTQIDEIGPDGDTTYIESTTPGDRQQIGFANLADEVELVGGIAFATYWRKTDAGECLAAVNVISGAVTGLGDVQSPPSGYQYGELQCFDLDPDGEIPWTPDKVDVLLSEIEHIGESGVA